MLVSIRKLFANSKKTGSQEVVKEVIQAAPPDLLNLDSFDLRPDDPFATYLLGVNGVVEIDKLRIDSPAIQELKAAGVKICVPLVSQGELIGLLNLGPRRSEQDYSADDRRLLTTLATQAAPALRVAQLAQQQQIEARERERIEQELRVARVIQQTLLPKEVPSMAGWKIAPFWQPARAVSGDFYDFIQYPDGNLGIVIADVTDKGVPAALVMATTRSIIRLIAEQVQSPGKVLAEANDLLCPDIPARMFVTCLFAVLDPASGLLRYANAGQDLPYLRTAGRLEELFARGMPLGLMPGMDYEEKEVFLAPGDLLLFSSDGLAEAHNAQREMFGFPRIKELMVNNDQGEVLVDNLMRDLAAFTGPDHEQEDDITLLVVERETGAPQDTSQEVKMETLVEFDLPSTPGTERQAADRVLAALADIDLSTIRSQRLETAVAEAVMNAMEHGNNYQDDMPVHIHLLRSPERLVVRITDHGSEDQIKLTETPDLDAKLAGSQSPRGWGLFLIQNMVDKMNISSDSEHHTIELVLNLQEG